MAPGMSALALSCAAMSVPAQAFVSPNAGSAGHASAPSLRSGAASAETPASQGWGVTTVACSGLAIAGVVAASQSRRRNANSNTAMRAAEIAERVRFGKLRSSATENHAKVGGFKWLRWEVEEIPPAGPNSFKTLGGMVGADVETNGEPWDPMGFSKLYDRNYDFNLVMIYPHVQWLREAEIKHGRVAMLAFVGMVAQQFLHIPGYPVEPDWSKAYEACYADRNVGLLGIGQIFGAIGLWEGRYYNGEAWTGKLDREPGDCGFDPLKLSKKPGFDLKKKQLAELKNGRLAMIGFASMMANHYVPGSVPLLSGSFAVKPEAKRQGASMGFCGKSAEKQQEASKTAARYTTQVILPQLTWIKSGVKAGDLKPKELKAKNLAGTDVLIGKDGNGKLFVVGNLCPHIATPLSEGAEVIGDVIVCPLHGSSFKVSTGELIDWCVSPPIIGPLTGFVIEKKNLAVFDSRTPLFGDEIEVLIDINAKKAYEADYWKGLLDSQGKDDGSYY